VAHPLWPLFDLRIRSEHLVLRLPTDDELIELAELARSGIHDAAEMPFGVPWTQRPRPAFEIGFVQHHWSVRATFAPEKWWLNLAVERDGSWVAAQTIAADNFPVFRTVDTGSWVAQRYQRQGIGKEMREAVLAFAFDHLGPGSPHRRRSPTTRPRMRYHGRSVTSRTASASLPLRAWRGRPCGTG